MAFAVALAVPGPLGLPLSSQCVDNVADCIDDIVAIRLNVKIGAVWLVGTVAETIISSACPVVELEP